MPQRVQRTRIHGQPGMPPGAKYCGRPGRYGNPFLISPVANAFPSLTIHQCQAYVVNDFRTLLDLGRIRGYGGAEVTYPSLAEIRADLAGHDLACWCPLWDEDGLRVPCHVDTLLAAANPPDAELLDAVAARDFIDFPTGFLLDRRGVPHWTLRCSHVQTGGAMLCDCDAIRVRWCHIREYLGLDVPERQRPAQQEALTGSPIPLWPALAEVSGV